MASKDLLEVVEKDFENGYLTLKGYKHRKLHIKLKEIEEDFEQGFLTEQGLHSKKSKILDELQGVEQLQLPATSDSESSNLSRRSHSTAQQSTNKLCRDESIHSTLSKLFKKNKTSTSASGVENRPKITLKSGCGSKLAEGGRTGSSGQLPRETSARQKTNKSITVVLLSENCNTIPKDKKKLRASNRVNFCSFLAADSVEDVNRKIRRIFPSEYLSGKGLLFFQPTQSGDLFNAASGNKHFSPDGQTILNLAGSGSLYISTCAMTPSTRCTDPVTVIVQPIVNKPHAPKLQVVPPTSDRSKEMKLRKDLFDKQFFHLVQSESLWHQPLEQKSDDYTLPPEVSLNKDKGEYLLSINFPVYCWLLKREMEGLSPLQEVDNFCIVSEKMFGDFENCKATLPQDSNVLLPLNELLPVFMDKHGIQIKTTEIFKKKFVIFPPDKVDELCDWILNCRQDVGLVTDP